MRDDDPGAILLRFAVTVETIACEDEGQRRKVGAFDTLGQPVGARRQRRELAEEQRLGLRTVGTSEAEEDAADIAVGVGKQDVPPGVRLESLRRSQTPLAVIKRCEGAIKLAGADRTNGNDFPGSLGNQRGKLHDPPDSKPAISRDLRPPRRLGNATNSVNEPLSDAGLTLMVNGS